MTVIIFAPQSPFVQLRRIIEEAFMSMTAISEKQFGRILKSRLGKSWERALAVFRGFGKDIAVAHALYHASNANKTSRVLDMLERHLKNRPRKRWSPKHEETQDNPDKILFAIISRDVLGFGREQAL
ncbi:MAG: hypothetical protein WCT54_01490 [Patescibacteria group bacterium]|jgi:hypothetical protein